MQGEVGHSRERIGHVSIFLPADLVQGQKIGVPTGPPGGCDLGISPKVRTQLDVDRVRDGVQVSQIKCVPGCDKKRQGDHVESNPADHVRGKSDGEVKGNNNRLVSDTPRELEREKTHQAERS